MIPIQIKQFPALISGGILLLTLSGCATNGPKPAVEPSGKDDQSMENMDMHDMHHMDMHDMHHMHHHEEGGNLLQAAPMHSNFGGPYERMNAIGSGTSIMPADPPATCGTSISSKIKPSVWLTVN
ncbi:MAG: hypothetical protein JST01_17075 [Cyanobacteria bacterium SZAS TMP-1]|nr:hypothetical protein [Cyanobacteria bacterium SZAS TMP-1]